MLYGFIIIFAAWAWQLWKFNKGSHSLNAWFLRLFALGQVLIVLDTFNIKSVYSWFNLATLTIVLILVWKKG